MLGWLLLLIRLPLVFLWVLSGISLMICLFPWMKRSGRAAVNRWWSRILLRLCGVRTRITGQPILYGSGVWVANHVSWKDIFMVNHVRAACFIAKSDIEKWPLLGWLVSLAGTIYIDRGNRKDVIRVSQMMAERIQTGEVVAFFPEGTTTEGFDILPFKAGLFQVAADQPLPVQPVVLHYYYKGKRSDHAAYAGEQNLVQNLKVVFTSTSVMVDIEFLPPIIYGPAAQMTRYEIAADLEVRVREGLQKRLREESQLPA